MTKLKSILLCLISVGVIGCNQSGEYTFTDGNQSQNVGSGQRDSRSGAIIKQELDEYGNLVDCGIGSSAKKLNLPNCNQVVSRRVEAIKRQKAATAQEIKKRQEYSESLISNKLAGNKLFTLPNGSKIRVKSRVVYNDEFSSLIINAIVEKVDSTSEVFENIFIGRTGRLTLNFVDSSDFDFLDLVTIPLNIEKGLSQNIRYRKKMGSTTSEIIGMKITARKPIRSLREYNKIARIDVSFRP